MPRKGYKSITVKENVYEYLKKEYERRKKDPAFEVKTGIRSFSAYVTQRLSDLIEEDKKRNPQ